MERDTAGVCPSPMRRVAQDWVKIFQSRRSCGVDAAARGMLRLAR